MTRSLFGPCRDQPGLGFYRDCRVIRAYRWKESRRWTALFLLTTVATSVTGFMFPFTNYWPSHVVGLYRWWCVDCDPRALHRHLAAAGAGLT